MGGMIRLIIDEGLYDREFVAAETPGLDELRRTVDPFDPATVARRADIPVDDFVAAARMFATAGRGRRGGGHRPGHVVGARHAARVPDPRTQRARAGATSARASWCGTRARSSNPCRGSAQASGPFPSYGFEPKLRVRGLGDTLVGPSTAAIADEILAPGRGPDPRARSAVAGTRLAAWPDQLKVREALESGGAAGAVRPVDVVDGEAGALRDRAHAVARGAGHDQLRRHAPGLRARVRPAEAVGAVHPGDRRPARRVRRDPGVGVLLRAGAAHGARARGAAGRLQRARPARRCRSRWT